MATTNPEAPDLPSLARTTLTARVEERFIAPFARGRFTRLIFIATVAAVLGLHAGVLFYVLRKDRTDPPKEVAAETAVEIVVEPPPPPPAPDRPAKTEVEKPAMSAPRAANEEKTETEKRDAETRAPQAPMPTDGKPEPEKQATAPETPPDKADMRQTEATRPADPREDAEALDRASPKPDPEKPKAIKPPVATRTDKTALQKLAGTSSLPDYKFARPTKKSPVTGGLEDARYLAIVFGMIERRFHPSTSIEPSAGTVLIDFMIDETGRVVDSSISERSGDRDFDEAALFAVVHASPFPQPPLGSPHTLNVRLDAARYR